jgi:hypothetical protein
MGARPCKRCHGPVDRPKVSADHCTWCLAIRLAAKLIGGRTPVDERREQAA